MNTGKQSIKFHVVSRDKIFRYKKAILVPRGENADPEEVPELNSPAELIVLLSGPWHISVQTTEGEWVSGRHITHAY